MIEKNINGIQFSAGQWPLDPDKATIIFIHGSGNSNRFWKSQVHVLSEYVNTIAIDLPGHGNSAGNGMDSVALYAMAVEEFIDAINAPFPIPCGLSLGGAIALQLLLQHEERYKAGILVNSGARLKVLPAIFETIKNNYKGYTDSFAAAAASAKTDTLLLQDVIADAEKCSPDVVYNDFLACNAFDVMERLKEITVPVLVMSAEDDKLSPAKYGKYLAANISNSYSFHIVDAGHLSPVEKPDEVNKAILEFLRKIAVSFFPQ